MDGGEEEAEEEEPPPPRMALFPLPFPWFALLFFGDARGRQFHSDSRAPQSFAEGYWSGTVLRSYNLEKPR